MSKAAESKHNFEPGEYPPKIDTDPDVPDAGLDFNPQEEDFFEAGRRIEKGESAIEEDETEKTEKRSVTEKIKNFFGFANKKTAEEKASLQQIEKGEVGSEGPVKLVQPELTELEALKARMDKANLDIRMVKLEGDAQTQLAKLQCIFEGLASGTKHEEQDIALYKKLKEKGSYEKMSAQENAKLEILEGRPVTDKDIEKMAAGEMPWTMNAAWKAMGKVRAATTGGGTGGVTKTPFSFGNAAAFVAGVGAGAVAGSMIAGANPDRGRGEPKPDEPTIDVAMDDAELNPLRVETEAQLKKAEEDEKKLIKELENIEEQLAECREYEYQEGENNPDRLKFLESHLGFFPPFDPDRTNSKDPVIIVMDDETYLNEIFKPNFDKLPVGAKLVTLERLLIKAKDALSKNKAICETNIERVRAERERIKKELESIPKAAPKKPKQPAPAPAEPAGEPAVEPKLDVAARAERNLARVLAEFAEQDEISVSILQRRLQIGYNSADQLLNLMEERGLIAPADGTKPRKFQRKQTVGEAKPVPAATNKDESVERARLLAEAKAHINKPPEPPPPPHEATVTMPPLVAEPTNKDVEPKATDAEKTKLEKERAAAAIRKAVVMPGLAHEPTKKGVEPKAPDAGKDKKEAVAKLMEAVRKNIADRAAKREALDIAKLNELHREIVFANPNKMTEILVGDGYLTEDEEKALTKEELKALGKEVAHAYWETIQKKNETAKNAAPGAKVEVKEKDPRQKAIEKMQQALIKLGEKALASTTDTSVSAESMAVTEASINKLRILNYAEYLNHLRLREVLKPADEANLTVKDHGDLDSLRDIEIAKEVERLKKAEQINAKKKTNDKPKTGTPKSGAQTATASAPEAPKPPDKGKEKRDRAMQEAGQILEHVDRVVALNLKAKIENMATVENNTAIIRGMDSKSYRVHLIKFNGFSQAISDALTDEDIDNLRNVEIFNAEEAYKKARRVYLTQINKQMTAKELVDGFEQINKSTIEKLKAADLIEMNNTVNGATKGDAAAKGLLKILIDKINA